MSKIEEALRKAQGGSGARTRPMSAVGVGMALQPLPGETRESLPESSHSLSKEIARMGESWFLTDASRAEYRIISTDARDARVTNAFRELRTKILERTGGKNCTVLVSSVLQGAGGSFVSLNLAVAFAFDEGKTALLIDCNLDKPMHNRLIAGDDKRGITDFFEDENLPINEIIHSIGVKRVRLIPAGKRTRGAAEYFTSNKIRSLLKGVRQRYPDRFIIIDAPPAARSADARILSEVCDYVLLVVPYGKATESQILNAAKSVQPEKLLGIVFNDEPQIPRLDWRALLRGRLKGKLTALARPIEKLKLLKRRKR